MATSDDLRRLIADARAAQDVAARYGGARRFTSGVGFHSINFSTADDPLLRWLEYCRDNPGPDAAYLEEVTRGLAHYQQTKEIDHD